MPILRVLLKLKYYAGLSVDDAADALRVSRATAYRHWTYARAWVRAELLDEKTGENGHFSLIATLVDWLCCHFSLVFLAFHPVLKLQQDVTDDRSSASPFVSDFFQVSKHSIATLNMIVRAYLTTNRNRAVEVA